MARRLHQDPRETVRRQLEAHKSVARELEHPNLESVRNAVVVVDECVQELNREAGVAERLSPVVRFSAVQGGFPVFESFRLKHMRRAAELLVETWRHHAEAFGAVAAAKAPPMRACLPVATSPQSSEYLVLYNTAISELLRQSFTETRNRQILRDLMVKLDLSQDELGRMFGVSGETIRRWERGQNKAPKGRTSELTVVDAALHRLTRVFRPQALPEVIRRKAEVFDGRRALDWILDGRIQDVADRYEAALAYQG